MDLGSDLIVMGIYGHSRLLEAGWTPPLQFARGGAWYPQAVGLEEGCGDTDVATTARFFMAGFSGWEIEFARPAGRRPTNRPLTCTKQGFIEMFGADRRCPW
jgi:hypothetical protein